MAATSPLASPAHLVSASETPSACLLASLAYFVFGTQVSIITYLPDPGGSEGPWAPSTSPACHTPPPPLFAFKCLTACVQCRA